ncbi:MAG: DUF4013 domain-containing protein [Candidatus Dojkabacteria bacterium]
MLESFKLKQSWLYLFKEKNWIQKLLIPIVPGVVFVILLGLVTVPALFLTAFADSPSTASKLSNLGGVVGPVVLLCFCCVLVVYSIIMSVISTWYQYEYTQVTLENRESNLITKQNKMDVIKKAGKLLLVNAIYNIPTFVIVGLLYVVMLLAGTVRPNSYMYGYTPSSSLSSGGLLVSCLLFFIIIFVVVPYNFYFVQTAKVRLIKTNTFREAFRIRTILETVKKNFKRLSVFLGILFVYIVGYGVISFGLSILGVIPLIGLCLIPFQIVLSVAIWYFGIFVYPYMVGLVYKEIK